MPGTGHSSRYKGSISNRNSKPAFQVLAPWNSKKMETLIRYQSVVEERQ